jgi:hypothetical protein
VSGGRRAVSPFCATHQRIGLHGRTAQNGEPSAQRLPAASRPGRRELCGRRYRKDWWRRARPCARLPRSRRRFAELRRRAEGGSCRAAALWARPARLRTGLRDGAQRPAPRGTTARHPLPLATGTRELRADALGMTGGGAHWRTRDSSYGAARPREGLGGSLPQVEHSARRFGSAEPIYAEGARRGLVE